MLTEVLEFLIRVASVAALVGMAGTVAAWALFRGVGRWGVVISSSFAAFLFTSVMILTQSGGSFTVASQTISQYLHTAQETQITELVKAGVASEKIEVFRHFYTQFVVLAFPAWSLLVLLLIGMFSYSISSALLTKITPRTTKAVVFREWSVPEYMVFGFIAGCILKLFNTDAMGDDHWRNILANNLLVFFTGLYTVAGLSVISHYFHRWRFPFFVRILGYFLLFNLASLAAATFGILDIWFDFRKTRTSTPREANP